MKDWFNFKERSTVFSNDFSSHHIFDFPSIDNLGSLILKFIQQQLSFPGPKARNKLNLTLNMLILLDIVDIQPYQIDYLYYHILKAVP